MQLPVFIYLLTLIAKTEATPATLVENAKCYETCIPPGMQWPVIISLLDKVANP